MRKIFLGRIYSESELARNRYVYYNQQDLIFQKGSGEVNFVIGQNSLVIENESGDESVQISINKYGAINTN